MDLSTRNNWIEYQKAAVEKVKNNYECGLNVEKFNDIKEGDIIEAYEEVEVARKLK